jgi:hypothetical protein
MTTPTGLDNLEPLNPSTAPGYPSEQSAYPGKAALSAERHEFGGTAFIIVNNRLAP